MTFGLNWEIDLVFYVSIQKTHALTDVKIIAANSCKTSLYRLAGRQ